jgi:hypothetical protein
MAAGFGTRDDNPLDNQDDIVKDIERFSKEYSLD